MKVLIIGYGSIGKRHVKNILNLGHEVIIYSKQKINKLSNEKIIVYNNLKDCLSESPKIAVITNITSLHVPIAIKLAKNNINLFIEKPLSNSNKNIKNLLHIIKQKKIITMVGCNLRFHECIIKIKKIISTQRLGRIISVQVESGSYLPDWHPYENYSKSYASRKELGGGVVLTCIHEIDYLYWFFGKVKEVFSITGKFSELKINVEDLSAISMNFQNGIIAEVHLDYFQRPEIRRCKIIGTKGTIYWDSVKNQVLFYDISKKKWKNELALKSFNLNNMYLKEIRYFLKCVKERKQTMNSVTNAAEVLDIALKIKSSSRLKRMVKI